MIVLFLTVVLSACGAFQKKDMSGPSPEQEEKDRRQILAMEKMLERVETEQALDAARQFQEESPRSTYLQGARYVEARALEDDEKWSEAAAIYRDIGAKTIGTEPKWAALSQVRLAYVAEATGDDLKALSHLMSAERMREHLPVHTGEVEIPARKAMLFSRLGREKETVEELEKTKKGLRVLFSSFEAKIEKHWLAQLYYQMGVIYPQTPSEERLRSHVRSWITGQSYLIRSLDLADPVWSLRAQETLIEIYSGTWNSILSLPPIAGADPMVAQRLKRERQVRHLTALLELVDDAKARRSLQPEKENTFQRTFYTVLLEIEEKAKGVLYTNAEMTVLTEESVLLNGFRREGRVFGTETLPEEKNASDPNL